MTQQSDHVTYAVKLLTSSMSRNGIWIRLEFEGAGILSLNLPGNFNLIFIGLTQPLLYTKMKQISKIFLQCSVLQNATVSCADRISCNLFRSSCCICNRHQDTEYRIVS